MRTIAFTCVPVLLLATFGTVDAQDDDEPSYLRDRGTGVSSSEFGSYIRRGELLIYPFFEYAVDKDLEYQPEEFGLGPNVDFRGKFHRYAGQIFFGYGLTDWLAIEFQAAYLSETLEKSPRDTFPTPDRIHESGLADIEGQVRVRGLRESQYCPELFGFVEITFPSQKDKLLIGEPEMDFRPGIGIIKGFSWGTVTLRTGYEWNKDDHHHDIGETSLEYLKRLSESWVVHVVLEGGETGAIDEWEMNTGFTWQVSDFARLKFNHMMGFSSKSTDWAPQLGVLFSFPK